jgi:hypothetical protein
MATIFEVQRSKMVQEPNEDHDEKDDHKHDEEYIGAG